MNDKVTYTIFKAIDEVNQLLPKWQRLEKSSDTVLFGQSGKLDSLGFVNLVVAAEQKIEEEFGIAINLANEDTALQNNSKFETIGTLVDHVVMLLGGKNGA